MARLDTTSLVKALAQELGFARVGVAPAGPVPQSSGYQAWLGRGYHGGMSYLARNLPQRFEPAHMVEGAKSVICLAMSCAPGAAEQTKGSPVGSPLNSLTATRQGSALNGLTAARQGSACSWTEPQANAYIARYARGRDYHKVLKKLCIELMDRIRLAVPEFQGRAFVDSAPVMERTLAATAGLGWLGDNGCLIVPGLGSHVLLCEIICNLPLRIDQPIASQCDHCGRCTGACPTGAIVSQGVVDARRCISYLTIENRGAIDGEFWSRIDGHLFGCDACQQACPFNRDVPPGDARLTGAAPPLGGATLADILRWTADDWDRRTRGAATRRATYQMFLRNAVLVAGNSLDRSLIEPLMDLSRRLGPGDQLAPAIDWAIDQLSIVD